MVILSILGFETKIRGESTIPERAELIFKQEKVLREQLRMLKKQMDILAYKKRHYQQLLAGHGTDRCNPEVLLEESSIVPAE